MVKSSIFDRVVCPQNIRSLLSGQNLSSSQLIFTNFDMCIDIVELCLGIAREQISSIFDRGVCPRHDIGGVLSFLVLLVCGIVFNRLGAFPTTKGLDVHDDRTTLRHSQTYNAPSRPLYASHGITKTCLYNFDPLKPHFYIVKLGLTGVYIMFLISAQNIDCGYSLEPPRRGGSNEYPQSMF